VARGYGADLEAAEPDKPGYFADRYTTGGDFLVLPHISITHARRALLGLLGLGVAVAAACGPSGAALPPTAAPQATLTTAVRGASTTQEATATTTGIVTTVSAATPSPAGSPTLSASPTGTPRPTTPPPTQSPSPLAVTGQAVQVTLTEFKLAMDPPTVQAGTVRFVVANKGTVVHSFEIRGGGIDQRTSNLNPGETETMQVDLAPGTYDVWCPIDGHKDLGMSAQLTVK